MPLMARAEPALLAPPCGDMERILELAPGQQLVARGVFTNGDVVMVMADEDGAFTVVFAYARGAKIRAQGGIFTLPPGIACIVDRGTDWEMIAPIFGEPA